MKDLVRQLKLDPDKTYLDSTTQDLLFNEGLTKARRHKVDDYITGKSDDKNGAILELAKEFASVGVPSDMVVGSKHLKKGESYYGGANKAFNSPEEVGKALDADRLKNIGTNPKAIPPQNDSGTQLDKYSKENKDLKTSPQSSTTVINNNSQTVINSGSQKPYVISTSSSPDRAGMMQQ